MASAPAARVLLCADDPAAADSLRGPLEQAGYAVAREGLRPNALQGALGSGLVVVDDSGDGPAARALCGRIRELSGDPFVPVLLVTGDAGPAARLAGLRAGADAYLLRPFEPAELLEQTRAFLRMKERHDRLAEKTAEVNRINKRLQAAYHLLDAELELASRIQESFLPQALPQLPQVRFAVHYRRCGRVGGDFYDVFRLDERHLGFYVADAMGHGVPASLLTVFVKKGVRAKEIHGREYRLVPPGEVLQRLNRDLIEQALSESPFITMAYALLNFADGTLSFARSGHPYPLYLPHDGPLQLWQLEGTLLGVFDTSYAVRTERLRPGDKLLLYTDGVDTGRFESQLPGGPSLLACAERHRGLPVGELVGRLALDLFSQTKQTDDLTLLGLEMSGAPAA
jgi:sigma-B regulation protein RsbU (phosphoserine phosphatase)